VPELLVFLILVFVFMRAQNNIVKEFTGYMKGKDEEIEVTIKDNTSVIRENTKVLGAALRLIEEDE
jgi:1,4-dihydroxy-2-naphthoate octaprenyltransferase